MIFFNDFLNLKSNLIKKNKYVYYSVKFMYSIWKLVCNNINLYFHPIKFAKKLTEDGHLSLFYDLPALLSKQYRKGAFNRMDIIVRYLFIEEFFGKNDYGFELYEKMQKRRGAIEHTSERFYDLIGNIENNRFKDDDPVILDQSLHLLDGSHRLACALYFDINKVPIKLRFSNKQVFYGLEWFRTNDFSKEELNLIDKKREELFEKMGIFFVVVLWPPIKDFFEEITSDISSDFKIISISDYTVENNFEFNAVVKGLYACDDIADWKIQKKIETMNTCDKKIRLISIEISNPKFRIKKISGKPISTVVERLKKEYREKYKKKIENYYYDNIIHIGDNYEHSKHMLKIVDKDIDIFSFLQSIKDYNYALTKSDVPYMVKNFPHDYPLSKDLDLICDKKDFQNICMAAKTFASKYKNKYSIRLLNYSSRLKIRFELSGFLCYQIDIGSEIDGINNPFVKKALDRRVKRDGFFCFSEKEEILIRILEYVQTPNKKHHLEYIRRHKNILQTVLGENKHLFKNDLEFIKQRLQEEERG
jgi:hypothetical protein